MLKPNFFIVGAPKCGTTALSEYLRTHPQIFFSTPKEPFYFSTDLIKSSFHTEHDYLEKCFKGSTSQHLAIGEGTTHYLYSQVAVKNIMKFNPVAKIIVMLRNPIDLVYSWHSELISWGGEDIVDFKEAWNKQLARKEGIYLPKSCPPQKWLFYSEIALLGQQLERLYQSVPREQVLVIWFDDFISQTPQVYNQVLQFLGVSPDGHQEFPKINENKVIRLPWLKFSMESLRASWLGKAVIRAKKQLGIKTLGIGPLIAVFNTKIQPRPPLDPIMRKVLIEEFREDIEKLSGLLDRDLSHWVKMP
ncbi:MAG: sulfotransferase [Candidatus Parabeggiatoa sp. nov. 1]|nr:MAG: sulfotransferase [Gammaproteobacteria bacterium]